MKYDLHIHTHYSACSNLKLRVILARAKKKGLDGIAITDHNSIKGALAVSKLNKDKDFEVIVGEEIMTDKGEILGLYLKKEIKPGDFFEVIKEIRKQRGIAVVAHPCTIGIVRKGAKLKDIAKEVDAVEGINSRAFFRFENTRAQAKARKMKLPMTAGSDSHFWFEIGRSYTEFDGDLRKALKNKKTKIYGSILFGTPGKFLSLFQKYIIK